MPLCETILDEPAHAVLSRNAHHGEFHAREVHFGDARWGEDLDAAVASFVQLRNQVVRHVLGTGDELT